MVALSMALVAGERKAAIHALPKHIELLSDKPAPQLAKFYKFLDSLKASGHDLVER